MAKFSTQLVLVSWALSQFGVDSFDRLSDIIRPPEFTGWAEDGGTKYVQQLIFRLPKMRSLSDEKLREYDSNIVGHWKHITRERNHLDQTLYPLYFQYLGLLFTEFYLDGYFNDRNGLAASLNLAIDKLNLRKGRREHFSRYTAQDLNKLAYWMATGSGKTLLMHCHIRQYLYYLGKGGRRQTLNRIILLTPNEGLSRQHLAEFHLSGMEAAIYDRRGGAHFRGYGVDIIDIHKLREVSGEKTIAVETFEGDNLVLVDEGHRGSGGEEWMDKRARLCARGFSFEYSATFGQAINAVSGEKQKALTETYAKCILFNYSYKFFYKDGYGKDFNILNLNEDKEEETRLLYLTACVLSFFQQCRCFEDGRYELLPYLLEPPLMVFVGGSVSGRRNAQEDTDLLLIIKFLAAFISDRKKSEDRLRKILLRQDGLISGDKRVFEGMFPYVESKYKPERARELFDDILRYVFNTSGGGRLHIVRLMGGEEEIGLRVGENPWFGVVNVGDVKKLYDLCVEIKSEVDNFVVESFPFSRSLFSEINRPGSTIRILAGAKKFTEGWSSWRVSSMGLMNIGRKEGSEIIQLFGRGVRLKGFRFKLKRSSALDAMDLQEDGFPVKHPEHIELLEMINIFGIRSNYMKEFEAYLDEEGVGDPELREVIYLPTVRLQEFDEGKIQLHVIRPKVGMPDFRATEILKLCSLEGKLSTKVVSNWYPRLQRLGYGAPTGEKAVLNKGVLRKEHLAFLSWDAIWFALDRYKRENSYCNIVFSMDDLRSLFGNSWWYELFIPEFYLEFSGIERRFLWQDIVIDLLNGYLDIFYNFHKKTFEAPYLEYHPLHPSDDLLLNQYQIMVKKSEKELIKKLHSLADHFRYDHGKEFIFGSLSIFQSPRHLYNPLIYLTHGSSADSLVKILPTHLNDGERDFVNHLEEVCRDEAKGILDEVDLYLLRNHSSSKAISFFSESGFRPDFILWLLKGGKQTIVFIDPKGMRNFTDNFNNPKVIFSKRIKELQSELDRDDIRLESFLLSRTHRNDLRWPSPEGGQEDATEDDYRKNNILFAVDGTSGYVRQLLSLLL